ncbi:hypothetical protein Daus18300_001310 [Diaporthe australafricana]|uniref:F-box domain-containing protein n=1 Tax=Diaporthe australafricana TaxID=127596 RepID=A0ABR3XXG1_9PEZI
MLNLANEPNQGTVLPFLKFPAEIRRNVYQFYFNNFFTSRPEHQSAAVVKLRSHNCSCLAHNSIRLGLARPLRMQLITTNKQIKDEALAMWFQSYVFHFACGCELKHSIQNNTNLSNNLESVKIHWTGPKSAEAFMLLKEVASLKSLVIVVSKSTTNNPSEKEALLKGFFRRKNQARLTEALGFDELLELSGVENIGVEHVQRSNAYRLVEEERNGLERLLLFMAQQD